MDTRNDYSNRSDRQPSYRRGSANGRDAQPRERVYRDDVAYERGYRDDASRARGYRGDARPSREYWDDAPSRDYYGERQSSGSRTRRSVSQERYYADERPRRGTPQGATRNGGGSRGGSSQGTPSRQRGAYDQRSGRPRQQSTGRQPRRSRDVYVNHQPSAGERVSELFAANAWMGWALAVLALIIVVFFVVNVVSCVGSASVPQEAATSSEPAVSSSTEQASVVEPVSQEGVESPWTDNGRFSTGDAELDAYIKKVCDEHSTEGETFDKNAYATNLYISQTDYIERASNQSPYGVGWDLEYAKQYFEKGNSGNCYNFAAVTQYVLRYFGYSDAEAEPCVVKLSSGGWGDHGLVFVTNKVDGKRCLVDDALSADGWMLDINAYDYDVRNIAQNPTTKGNVDALDDDEEPMRIQPGNLTEGHEND